MDERLLILAAFVLLAYTTHTLAGFGSNVIALTLGAHFYGFETLLPALVPLTLIVNLYLVIRHRAHIDLRLLFTALLPFMVAGLLVGILLFQYLGGSTLKVIYSGFIVALSSMELALLWKKHAGEWMLPPLLSRFLILIAGAIQGIFASGGPLLVYAISRLRMNKAVFRSTLSSMWLILNSILVGSYIITGKLTGTSLKFSALMLPMILLGIFTGERIHRFINEFWFKVTLYAILLFSGLALLLRF